MTRFNYNFKIIQNFKNIYISKFVSRCFLDFHNVIDNEESISHPKFFLSKVVCLIVSHHEIPKNPQSWKPVLVRCDRFILYILFGWWNLIIFVSHSNSIYTNILKPIENFYLDISQTLLNNINSRLNQVS